MTKKDRAKEVVGILKSEYPNAKIALDFGDEFQLLVAVILSAQCTDVRVNMVTPPLFKRFPSPSDFASCDIEELEKMIFSTGFYRAKAKNIRAAANMIVDDFGGKVPSNMEDLLKLPGVARKTANVVLHTAFGISTGVVVDTHVIRLAGKLKLVDAKFVKPKNAVKIETALMKLVDKKDWGVLSHLLILHGRSVCIARRPKCAECKLNKLCPSISLKRVT